MPLYLFYREIMEVFILIDGVMCPGGRIVTREDIMEAIEREKFGINENKANAISGSKCLEKLFPWLPSLAQGSVKFKNRDRNAIGSRRVLSN